MRPDKIIALPEGTDIPYSKSSSYYTSNYNKKRIKDALKQYIRKSRANESSALGLLNFHLDRIMELAKCQGGYTSLTILNNNRELDGLIGECIQVKTKFGDIENILDYNMPIGTYFPMKPGLLHKIAGENNAILFCNDPAYLRSGHNCPGIVIQNLMYIPIIYHKELIGLICLCNRKGGFNMDLYHYIESFVNMANSLIKEIRISKGMDPNEKMVKLNPESDYSSYILKNAKEMAVIIDMEYNVLTISNSAINEYTKTFRNINLKEGDNLLDKLDKYENAEEIIDAFNESLKGIHFSKVHQIQSLVQIEYWDSLYSPIFSSEKIVGAYCFAKILHKI